MRVVHSTIETYHDVKSPVFRYPTNPGNAANGKAPRWHAPASLAILCGSLYMLLCSLYIWLSGLLASNLARNMAALYRMELMKGLLFVLISTVLFTIAIYLLLRRVARTEGVLREQHTVLEMIQQKAGASLLASSIAHDMNNMLMVLQASAMKLEESAGLPAPAQAELENLQRNVEELISLAQHLQNSASASAPKDHQEVNLAAIIGETVQLARRHPRAKGVEIDASGVAHLKFSGYQIILRQMVLNLLLNAIDASASPGKGQVNLVLKELPEEHAIVLEVHDNGSGVPEQQRELIFSPYYTTKESGTGLGLLSVKAGVKAHGGKIAVHSSPLGGACFAVTLPLSN